MPNFGDRLRINSSNGLSLRDGPNTRGTTIKKLDNESFVTLVAPDNDVQKQGGYNWAYVETEDGLRGWIAVDDGRGNVYAKPIVTYRVKVRRNRRSRNRRATKTGHA